MIEKKQPDGADGTTREPADKARAGGKPGRIGDTGVAPEHDLAMEKKGRREFGRDG